MTETDVEIILQRGLEKHPRAKPRIISDNGSQFIARDFKEFIRIAGLTTYAPRPITPRATVRSNAGTSRSKLIASAQASP